MSAVPTPTYTNLTTEQKSTLIAWLARAKGEDAKRAGLFCFGERGAGSSYVAEVAFKKAWFEDQFTYTERVDARQLEHELRKLWTLQEQTRRHADDMGLYMDAANTEMSVDFLWTKCDVVWIDNVHHASLDMRFWWKHIFPNLEYILRDKRAVIISGTLPANDPALPKNAMRDYFLPVFCDHAEG